MKMFGPVEHNYAMGWRFKWDKLSAQDDARGDLIRVYLHCMETDISGTDARTGDAFSAVNDAPNPKEFEKAREKSIQQHQKRTEVMLNSA